MRLDRKFAAVALLSLLIASGGAACRKKGPAERAGEEIDDAVERAKDAIDPKGPAEKAGEKIDKAFDD